VVGIENGIRTPEISRGEGSHPSLIEEPDIVVVLMLELLRRHAYNFNHQSDQSNHTR
jgi:hypothetical protein